MGNGLSPCSCASAVTVEDRYARLVYWGGPTRLVTAAGRRSTLAGDVAAEFPDQHIVCVADSFFIGLRVPALLPGEQLVAGHTYFVIPAARLSCRQPLTAGSLASLSTAPAKVSLELVSASPPLEYVKGEGGVVLIRVLPEFIEEVITRSGDGGGKRKGGRGVCPDQICSTPQLRKHYMQLVGTRQQRPWLPRLETISEAGRWRRRMGPPKVRLARLARSYSEADLA